MNKEVINDRAEGWKFRNPTTPYERGWNAALENFKYNLKPE